MSARSWAACTQPPTPRSATPPRQRVLRRARTHLTVRWPAARPRSRRSSVLVQHTRPGDQQDCRAERRIRRSRSFPGRHARLSSWRVRAIRRRCSQNVEENRTWLGPETLAQLPDGVVPDAVVGGVGTGGTIVGVGQCLRERNPSCKVVAVEPNESCILTCGEVGRRSGCSWARVPARISSPPASSGSDTRTCGTSSRSSATRGRSTSATTSSAPDQAPRAGTGARRRGTPAPREAFWPATTAAQPAFAAPPLRAALASPPGEASWPEKSAGSRGRIGRLHLRATWPWPIAS